MCGPGDVHCAHCASFSLALARFAVFAVPVSGSLGILRITGQARNHGFARAGKGKPHVTKTIVRRLLPLAGSPTDSKYDFELSSSAPGTPHVRFSYCINMMDDLTNTTDSLPGAASRQCHKRDPADGHLRHPRRMPPYVPARSPSSYQSPHVFARHGRTPPPLPLMLSTATKKHNDSPRIHG